LKASFSTKSPLVTKTANPVVDSISRFLIDPMIV
jgi:hypothetical protein